MPEHLGTCKQLGERYRCSPSHYISHLSSMAANISKATGCPIPKDEKRAWYWPILFRGKRIKDKSQGSYCWKMRKRVVEAVEMLINEGVFAANGNVTMNQFDHNLILYGPPGTGKTYYTVIYAVAICESRSVSDIRMEPYTEILQRYKAYREAGQIAFTTFHQSYGYEEFIEGIKPKLNTENNTLGYSIEDGLFKAFCNHAKAIKVQVKSGLKMKEQPRIWGMILGGSGMTELKQQCFANII